MLSNRRFQFGVLAAFSLCVAMYGALLFFTSHSKVRPQPYSKTNAADYDTKGLVPGNPENGRRALKNLFAYYKIHRQKHGSFPPDVPDLYNDIIKNPSLYGLRKSSDMKNLLANPDNQYSDNIHERKSPTTVTFSSEPNRPDGTALYGPKVSGKDVIAYSTTYLHGNVRQFSNYRSTANPVGFYQVLWDNGMVENIPYDKMLYVQTSPPRKADKVFRYAFPGQAGTPTNAMSYDEYWTKIAGWQTPPRGVAGGKGTSYNRQSYR